MNEPRIIARSSYKDRDDFETFEYRIETRLGAGGSALGYVLIHGVAGREIETEILFGNVFELEAMLGDPQDDAPSWTQARAELLDQWRSATSPIVHDLDSARRRKTKVNQQDPPLSSRENGDR